MIDRLVILGLTFLIITLAGFYLAYRYAHHARSFKWSEYIAIIIWPGLFVIALAYYIDGRILGLFVVSSFLGLVLEYILGLTFHKVLHRRLWTYKKLNLDGYTSWLVFPVWGIAGVIFWFASKIVGL